MEEPTAVVAIVGTPWARAYLTPEIREAIVATVPAGVVKVSLGAGRRPGDWSAHLFGPIRGADPLGSARNARTLTAAVGAAAHDMTLGAPLAWCSTCPAPATRQTTGEAYCRACEPTRGGAIQ
jgi:hypothetical protein